MQFNFNAFQELCADLEFAAKDLAEATTELAKTGDHLALIRHFSQTSTAYDVLSEAKKKINDTYDRLSREIVPEAMRVAKVKTVNLDDVGRVTVSHRYSASMLDKELGMGWLRDNGHGDLIKPTVNAQTLSSFAKNLMVDEGKELPEEIFKVGTSPFTSITKAK